MYTKTEIFQNITEIMGSDYVGYLEKSILNRPNDYLITDDMDDIEFTRTIQSYLLDFRDNHLSFSPKNSTLPFKGFKVRRFEDAIYVTEVNGEVRLQVGDEIIALDGLLIPEYAEEHEKILYDQVHERQLWDKAIRQVQSLTFRRDQQVRTIELKEYPKPAYVPEYSYKQLNPQTAYMKITDFEQNEPIQQMVSENQKSLKEVQNLIIEVRVNHGGNDLFYLPLLEYFFKEKVNISEFFEPDQVTYTNYTINNCDLWINELQNYLEQPLDVETKDWVDKEIMKFKSLRGKGMLPAKEEVNYVINGCEFPENIYILSDVTCGSSGDSFVKNAKISPKVTVVGRATKGILDYYNVVTKDYGDYEFVYSISKMNEKYHCNDTGILPDVHIPWTPKHLTEDVDLEYVLRLCNVPV